jgi:hypothetical protein
VSPVRYEHPTQIESKAIPVVYVSPVRYEHLHIKSKAVPVVCVSCAVRTSSTNKVNLSLTPQKHYISVSGTHFCERPEIS